LLYQTSEEVTDKNDTIYIFSILQKKPAHNIFLDMRNQRKLLVDQLDRKSRNLAETIILRTNQNMMLENQEIDKKFLENAIEDLSNEIKVELKKAIWD